MPQEALLSIHVDWEDAHKQLQALEDLVHRPVKGRLFRNIAQLLATSWWSETFRLQGARRGHEKWYLLKPEYLSWKIAHGKPAKILQLTGHLLGSKGILEEGESYLIWGTNIPYAIFHQDPSKIGHPPKREILFVTQKDLGEIEEFTKQFLEMVMEEAAK